MLNANVAFLAIQSIDEEATLPERSAAQLASYVSILASIGSIILGLLLVRQNRTKTRESAVEAVRNKRLSNSWPTQANTVLLGSLSG